MDYVGLVSVVVAVTNLIPNFGPIIGMVIGGFVLLLVNPLHAVMFVVFSIALQFVDGYILKPKLFSGTLGVSGLLILVASIVLGNMFGVWGMILSVPIAAILSFVWRDYVMPRREKKRRTASSKKAKEPKGEEEPKDAEKADGKNPSA
jgi:predicted PurR-regulated permease PerM